MDKRYISDRPLEASCENYTPQQKQAYANLVKALKIELKPLGLKFRHRFTNEASVGRTPEELLTLQIDPRSFLKGFTSGPYALLRGPDRNGMVIVDVWDEKMRDKIEELVEKLRTGLELDFKYVESMDDIKQRVKEAQIHYMGNGMHLDGLLINERGYASRAPTNEDVVVLISGGLDSSIMVQRVIEDFGVRVHPLFIKRGAKSEKFEEEAFDFFVQFYQKRFPEKIREPRKLVYEVPPRDFKDNFPSALAKTVGYPLRNSTLQNLAVMYAVSLQTRGIEARTIFSGSVAEDNTEPELGLLSLRSQTVTTCIEMADWRWNITSPLTDLYLTEKPVFKVDLINYAIERGIPLNKTRTCFSSDEIADGTCIACLKRLKAFNHLGIKDTVKYKDGKYKRGGYNGG